MEAVLVQQPNGPIGLGAADVQILRTELLPPRAARQGELLISQASNARRLCRGTATGDQTKSLSPSQDDTQVERFRLVGGHLANA